MPDSTPSSLPHDAADVAAEAWFIRRDRGLSAAEQAAFQRWLQADPRHATALARVEKLWRVLDPAVAALPVEAVAAATSRRYYGWWTLPLVAAAAAAAVFLLRTPQVVRTAPADITDPQAIVIPGPERLTLPDGSVVDLAAGAQVDVQFTPELRRVNLVQGTAFFAVAKNPARPFVVSTGEVSVRAVGTAFSVGLDSKDVSVLVTEGRVRVQETLVATALAGAVPRDLSALGAGQQGIVRRASPEAPMRWAITVTQLTPAEMERALGWQGPRLEFADLPLSAVVTAFNRYSAKQLVVGDATIGATRVGGNFRADRPDAFLRALEVGFNISASPHGNEIILYRSAAR